MLKDILLQYHLQVMLMCTVLFISSTPKMFISEVQYACIFYNTNMKIVNVNYMSLTRSLSLYAIHKFKMWPWELKPQDLSTHDSGLYQAPHLFVALYCFIKHHFGKMDPSLDQSSNLSRRIPSQFP